MRFWLSWTQWNHRKYTTAALIAWFETKFHSGSVEDTALTDFCQFIPFYRLTTGRWRVENGRSQKDSVWPGSNVEGFVTNFISCTGFDNFTSVRSRKANVAGITCQTQMWLWTMLNNRVCRNRTFPDLDDPSWWLPITLVPHQKDDSMFILFLIRELTN